MRDVAGTLATWGFSNKPARQGDLHWNGSAWAACPLGFRSEQTARDAKGVTAYNDCDGWELGVSQRTSADVGGQLLLAGVVLIRKFPGADSGVNYADWGPTNLLALGKASFPSGSLLHYQTNQVLATAATYDVTSKVGVYSAA
ncbi:MAG TPA: hypothetical protein DCW29_20425, partial [Janthinobacterium sp.]|nr:hypothetical protein [Janthinobacterium sp.]